MGELRQDLADTITALRSGRADGDREALKAFRTRIDGLGFRLKDVLDVRERAEADQLHADADALWKTLWHEACSPPS